MKRRWLIRRRTNLWLRYLCQWVVDQHFERERALGQALAGLSAPPQSRYGGREFYWTIG